ncbi:MAG TPA: rhodanese-like domain-containing protein [Candidatus Nanopelagicales bacterium]|nr:rhodanese-like domain-containing protein [Candidatus Nanopelagicales bacterium]
MSRPFARRPFAIFVLGAAALVAACSPATPGSTPGAATPAPSAPAVGVQALPAEVSTADALALREAGAFILDVRQPEEWAAGHIPDATLIPLGDLASRVAEVPKDRQIVVVCRSGNRSAQGRNILLGAGYPSVTSMAGGMNDWTAAGYPTESGS